MKLEKNIPLGFFCNLKEISKEEALMGLSKKELIERYFFRMDKLNRNWNTAYGLLMVIAILGMVAMMI